MKIRKEWAPCRSPRLLKQLKSYRIIERELPVYSPIIKNGVQEQAGYFRQLVIEESYTNALGEVQWREKRSDREARNTIYFSHSQPETDLLFDILQELL